MLINDNNIDQKQRMNDGKVQQEGFTFDQDV